MESRQNFVYQIWITREILERNKKNKDDTCTIMGGPRWKPLFLTAQEVFPLVVVVARSAHLLHTYRHSHPKNIRWTESQKNTFQTLLALNFLVRAKLIKLIQSYCSASCYMVQARLIRPVLVPCAPQVAFHCNVSPSQRRH